MARAHPLAVLPSSRGKGVPFATPGQSIVTRGKRRVVIGGSSSIPAAAFDPANKSADFTLSNGNLTSTRTASATTIANAKATLPKTTGSWHVEFTLTAQVGGAGVVFGVALSAFSNTTSTGGAGTGAAKSSGGIAVDGTSYGAAGDTFTTGDIVAVELDATTGNVYFQKLGGTGRKGPYPIAVGAGLVPLFGMENGASGVNSVVNINAGQSAFAITPTGGFLAWS